MKKNMRLTALLVCAVFLMFMLFSSVLIVHEAGHDCIGADCAICAQIASCEQLMKIMVTTAAAVTAAAILTFLTYVYLAYSAAAVRQSNLVALKIKLSN